MHSCKFSGNYPRNQKLMRNFNKKITWLVSEFSNRMMTSGLNNGRLKTGVVNMSTP